MAVELGALEALHPEDCHEERDVGDREGAAEKILASEAARQRLVVIAQLDLAAIGVGLALAPGIIAAAVFAGRRYAEELEEPRDEDAPPFKREVPELTPGPLPWSSAQ